jgi:hypothetical protein
VGECALWARLTGPQFAAQVAAAVSQVEAHTYNGKAAAVAKEAMAITPGSRTGLSIEKFLEAPFAGKHPKLIKKGTKAAAAEAAVTATEAIAVADLEETKRLAAEFEAMGSGALTMALAGGRTRTLCAIAGSHASGSACRRPARSTARKF